MTWECQGAHDEPCGDPECYVTATRGVTPEAVPVRDHKFVQVSDVEVFTKILDGVRYVVCDACGRAYKESINCPACGLPRWSEMYKEQKS